LPTHPIHRSAGHPFFLEGEPGSFALWIRKGYVKAMRGRPPRIIDIRGPGQIVGEMAIIVAFNDVEALYLPGMKWLQFLYDHPRAMHALAKRLTELNESGLAERVGDGAKLLRLSRHDLAALIGARKLDSVKKIIARLKASDILSQVARGDLTIP
jgi:CRP/FNR family transcriptional regulator, cyclic AMP receptor protein